MQRYGFHNGFVNDYDSIIVVDLCLSAAFVVLSTQQQPV